MEPGTGWQTMEPGTGKEAMEPGSGGAVHSGHHLLTPCAMHLLRPRCSQTVFNESSTEVEAVGFVLNGSFSFTYLDASHSGLATHTGRCAWMLAAAVAVRVVCVSRLTRGLQAGPCCPPRRVRDCCCSAAAWLRACLLGLPRVR